MTIRLGLLFVLGASAAQEPPADHRKITAPRDVIALEAGTWDAAITILPRTAGGKPATAAGVQINELRSGGLAMLNRMSVNGGAYEGTGIWVYDPATGRYPGAWVDNGTAGIRRDEGFWHPETRTMTWMSQIERADGRVQRLRATSTFAGASRTYRSFEITDSGEQPLSIVVFTRRPDSQQ